MENVQSVTVTNKRSGMVDIYRLLLVLVLVWYHLGVAGKPFYDSAWIFVEFFFILSGYLTMRHYANLYSSEVPDLSERGGEAIRYTLHKSGRLLPYVVIAGAVEYVSVFVMARYYDIFSVLASVEGFISESLLLTSSGLTTIHDAPLWYLSAMFLVFPLFCLLLSFPKMWKWYYGYLSWILAALYYGCFGIVQLRTWPHDMLRAFVCLWLGVFVFGLCEQVAKLPKTKFWTIIFTVVELGSFAFAIARASHGVNNKLLIIMCFITGLVALMSGRSLTAKIGYIPFIANLSLAIFLLHWPIRYFFTDGATNHIGLYFLVTILISAMVVIIVMLLQKLWKHWRTNHGRIC